MAGPFSLGARCENFPIRYWDDNVPEVGMGPAEKTTTESALAGVYSGERAVYCATRVKAMPEFGAKGVQRVRWATRRVTEKSA